MAAILSRHNLIRNNPAYAEIINDPDFTATSVKKHPCACRDNLAIKFGR